MNKRQRKKFLKKYVTSVFNKVYRDSILLGNGIYEIIDGFPYILYKNPLKETFKEMHFIGNAYDSRQMTLEAALKSVEDEYTTNKKIIK